MFAVKLNANLRIKENGRYRIIQEGTIFRGKEKVDLPEWLQKEMDYMKKTPSCATLIISEVKINKPKRTKPEPEPISVQREKLKERQKKENK